MSDTKHFNIPVFIPHAACPHQCVFCNQKNISGATKPPTESEIHAIIKSHLSTIPPGSNVEIAFFGGSFTALPASEQERYLNIARPYINDKLVQGIRLSTRPDYINYDILALLKKYNVSLIELGAQSMDDEVLRLSERGHTQNDVVNASKMIKESDFLLGLQMMIGLPGDTPEISLYTARKIIELKADCARIYPTLVIKGTMLENLYNEKKYRPLELSEAIDLTTEILQLFETAGISVIRTGLHPSEGLISGSSLVAGPFHQSFRELVLTEIWRRIFREKLSFDSVTEVEITVPEDEYNYAIGYSSINKNMLKEKFRKVIFRKDAALTGRNFHADYR